jgi:lipopolysaccharide/colanic/teichoic acid biosynthesis glycosyltransferase
MMLTENPSKKRAYSIPDRLKNSTSFDSERMELLETLHNRFKRREGFSGLPHRQDLRFLFKRIAWQFVVGGAQLMKRILDVLASAFLGVLLSPLFAVVALLIKVTDGGSVFYWQQRVGRYGKTFMMPKFRSMVQNADGIQERLSGDQPESLRFKMKADPRITWIGKIMRKLSIDELPQLWNILRGEMSLVGPRPPIPSEVAEYGSSERRRLEVIPGLTCIWQVSGRSEIPFEDQVRLDVQYIESQGTWLDLKLLLLTIPAVLTGRGAY